MRTENKHGRKFVICDNLGEFFAEFKKYRASKSGIAKKENYSEHVFPELECNEETSQGKDAWKLFFIDLDFEGQKPFWSLGLDISALKIKGDLESKWNPQERKIIKILHEIWESGENENTQDLDLNWPVPSKKNDKPVENPPSSPIKSSDKESKIIWWIGCGILFMLFISFLVYLIRKRKKIRVRN